MRRYPMNSELKILFVEDVRTDAELAMRILAKEGILFQSRIVETEANYIKELEEFLPDIIISDYNLPTFSGMEALKIALEKFPQIPFILLTGSISEDTAVECIKAGAWDYIIKEHITRLPFSVKETLDKKQLRLEKAKAELVLFESEVKYRTLFENVPVGIGVTDLNGNLIAFNDAILKPGNYTREDITIIGNVRSLYYNLADREIVLSRIREKGTLVKFPIKFKRKDETAYDALITITTFNVMGQMRVLTVVEDITEKIHDEELIKEKMEELQRFHDLTVGRELTMIALKREVNELLKKMGLPQKYKIIE